MATWQTELAKEISTQEHVPEAKFLAELLNKDSAQSEDYVEQELVRLGLTYFAAKLKENYYHERATAVNK